VVATSAEPSAVPSESELPAGEPVTVDAGAALLTSQPAVEAAQVSASDYTWRELGAIGALLVIAALVASLRTRRPRTRRRRRERAFEQVGEQVGEPPAAMPTLPPLEERELVGASAD
jgi:hypothetical protein